MEHELDAYRKQCADICAAVPKNPTNLKLVFDLETTGLNPAEDEILEAAIVTTDGDILFESRFKPACVTEWPKAQNVNGISPEMVADAPGIIDKIGEMAALLQNAETIIGYNGKHFDIPFLECYGIRFRPDAMVSDPMLDGAVVYGELRTNNGAPSTYKWKNLKTMPIFAAIQAQTGTMQLPTALLPPMCGNGYKSRICENDTSKTCRLSKNSTTGSLGPFPNRLYRISIYLKLFRCRKPD